MKSIVSLIISKIKGEKFILDNKIPTLYLTSLIWSKLLMFINGSFLICKEKKGIVCIAFKAIIKSKSKLYIKGNVNIGRFCYIDCLSTEGVVLGNNVSIGMNTTIMCTGHISDIGKGLIIGNNVGLGSHGFWGCAGGIEVGDDTIFGNFVSLHSENHNFNNPNIPIRLQGVNRKGITIGKNCWIGSKVTILDGVILEDNCIIAAGSVVLSGKYEQNSIYGGVPAKFIKYINEDKS